MADQGIPRSSPHDDRTRQVPPEWQLFFRELLRRIADLERRVSDLET